MYVRLKKELNLVTEINSYITGSLDEGLLMITGKLNTGISFEDLDSEIWRVLNEFSSELISKEELDRLNIKIRTAREFQDQGLLNRAMNLCHFELLGDAAAINEDLDVYNSITPEMLKNLGVKVLKKQNCSVLRLKKKL